MATQMSPEQMQQAKDAATKAADAAKAAKEAKAAEKAQKQQEREAKKAAKQTAHGITRPADPKSKTGRVWAISDEISNQLKKPAPRKDVMERARAEGINEATVATHVQHILAKLGLRSRAQIAVWSAQHGLLDEPEINTADDNLALRRA